MEAFILTGTFIGADIHQRHGQPFVKEFGRQPSPQRRHAGTQRALSQHVQTRLNVSAQGLFRLNGISGPGKGGTHPLNSDFRAARISRGHPVGGREPDLNDR